MKTTTTFSSFFLNEFENFIFITRFKKGWQKEWEILKDNNGGAFLDLEDAIDFVREQKMEWGVGLATFKQAKMENAEWTNL